MSRALGLVAGLLAVAAFSGASASALAPTALIPPQLQALEQKMEQLQINSERFSDVSRGYALGSPSSSTSGKPEHDIRTSLNGSALGEVSVSPAEGWLFINSKRSASSVEVLSTVD